MKVHQSGTWELLSLSSVLAVFLLASSLIQLSMYKRWSEQDKLQIPEEAIFGSFSRYVRIFMLFSVFLWFLDKDFAFSAWSLAAASESYFASCKPRPPMYRPTVKTVMQ